MLERKLARGVSTSEAKTPKGSEAQSPADAFSRPRFTLALLRTHCRCGVSGLLQPADVMHSLPQERSARAAAAEHRLNGAAV
jgi:hypothetical protein